MTGVPEAALARELALCYTSIALVTDLDAGLEHGEGVTHDEVLRVFAANIEKVRDLLLDARRPRCPTRRRLLLPPRARRAEAAVRPAVSRRPRPAPGRPAVAGCATCAARRPGTAACWPPGCSLRSVAFGLAGARAGTAAGHRVVLVAARDLPGARSLGPDDLRLRELPAGRVPDGALHRAGAATGARSPGRCARARCSPTSGWWARRAARATATARRRPGAHRRRGRRRAAATRRRGRRARRRRRRRRGERGPAGRLRGARAGAAPPRAALGAGAAATGGRARRRRDHAADGGARWRPRPSPTGCRSSSVAGHTGCALVRVTATITV